MTPAAPASNILGISAKSLHAGRKPSRGAASAFLPVDGKAERFELLRTAQALIYDSHKGAAEQARVVWCQRTINTGGDVGVYRTAAGDNARISGMHTCGSVWDCPVCSAKITEARRAELSAALAAWIRVRKAAVNLLTLTFPHEADHALAELVEKQSDARQRFANCRTWKRIREAAGYVGQVRSLEATVGVNGWHPHTHDLLFLERDLTERERDELTREWVRILVKVGLGGNVSDMMAHSLDVRDGKFAAEYVAKFGRDSAWGASSELTRPHAKVGASNFDVGGEQHFTPFQLLVWAGQRDDAGRMTDAAKQAGARFREFSGVFRGKRMLSWSPGLRKLLTGLTNELAEELTDEQLAAIDRPMADEQRVGQLTPDQFKIILRTNRMGDFLRYVATCANDQGDLDDYIASIGQLPSTHGSDYRMRNTMRKAGSSVAPYMVWH